MIESHSRWLYKLLKHEGYYTRVGTFDYSTNKYEEKYLKGIEEVLNYVRPYDGKRNCFLSRNPRNSNGAVCNSYCLSFDLDPIRPKGEASTNEQHNMAILAGKRILERYPGGLLCSSGNGCLLLYTVHNGLGDLDVHYRKEKILIQEFQELVNDLGVKVDETNYSNAIIKLIGTTSTKGRPEDRRVSRFLTPTFQASANSPKLLERLANISVQEQAPTQRIDVKQFLTDYNGDRSLADFHLVAYLKKSGLSPADALKALQANPLGRQTDEKDQARLIEKIYGPMVRPSGIEPQASYFTELFRQDSTDMEAISTGIRSLDVALGGLPKGEITTFAARSGYGKTSLACTASEHLRKSGRRVLFFSTEMERKYIMHKYVAIACNIPLAKVLTKTFSAEEIKRIRAYEQELLLSSVNICDEFQPKIEQVQNEVIKYKPDVIVFDHISQVDTSWQNVADFARKLKDLTAKENCVTLMLSQLNEPGRSKDGQEAQSIRGDVRGSQEIIFLSAIFAFISDPYAVKTQIQPVELHIAKHRYGISGTVVPLIVNKETGKFEERGAE